MCVCESLFLFLFLPGKIEIQDRRLGEGSVSWNIQHSSSIQNYHSVISEVLRQALKLIAGRNVLFTGKYYEDHVQILTCICTGKTRFRE